MIELLVVIVVFLIGVLAVIQVFPGGFRIIARTRSVTIANQLARAEAERLRGLADSLPEMILPIQLVHNGTDVVVQADPTRDPNNLGPQTNFIDYNGNVHDAADNVLGSWSDVTGANAFRRIIGEGGPVPAPRRVGAELGGLRMLNFAPISFDAASDNLHVYGSNMVKREGAPVADQRVVEYEYFIEDPEEPGAKLYLPAETPCTYRVTFRDKIKPGAEIEILLGRATVAVPASPGTYFEVDLGTLSSGAFIGSEFDSIQVAREFERVAVFSANPYEYRLLDPTLGLLLFNPIGATFVERQPGGRRVPLRARVDYDVRDWRVIRDEFRVPDNQVPQIKLRLGSLMRSGGSQADQKTFNGLPIPVQVVGQPIGTTERRDFILMDVETGGIFVPQAYRVDPGYGVLTLVDQDGNLANGLQADLVPPNSASTLTVNLLGRSVRAFYRARSEWAMQVMKAADRFDQVLRTPTAGECYVGGSGAFYGEPPLNAGESDTRVYFPRMEAGKTVSISEVWYTDTGGQVRLLQDQVFLIQSTPIDPVGLPYVDIRSAASDATGFDFGEYGYAVRGVRGASISVRVLWNPSRFSLSTSYARNQEVFEEWARNWRRVSSETYIQRRDTQ